MPERIQRKRSAGWRKPNGAVCVDRTSGYGNPFTAADAIAQGQAASELQACAVVVAMHERWLDGYGPDTITSGARTFDRRWVHANLHRLAGRTLACYCDQPQPGRPDICHAVTLGRRADALVPAL